LIERSIIDWHRAGRTDKNRTLQLARSPARVFIHFLLSFLPAGLHKFFTDPVFARERLAYVFVDPSAYILILRCVRNGCATWCRRVVKNSLISENADEILSKLHEPFIQKYIKSLAVHVCTLPVNQIVSVSLAIIYVIMNPGLTTEQAWLHALGIIAALQVVPVSPGSHARGLYMVYLVIRERNIKDYTIVVFLGFFKIHRLTSFPEPNGLPLHHPLAFHGRTLGDRHRTGRAGIQ